MATSKRKRKKKKAGFDLTLWGVLLSFPDIHEPKPYKGNIRYRTDVLMDEDHAQLGTLRGLIKKVKVATWGADKSEWVKAEKPLIQDGNAREDQKEYKDKRYITPSTQTPVPVVDLKGKAFNAQMVKGGMYANVAVRVSAWEYDGDEGVSIYLQGIQIDTSKAALNFGGGKTTKQMFKKGRDDEDDEDGDGDDQDDDADDSDDDEDDDRPRGKKKKKPSRRSRDDSDDDDSDDEDEDDSDDSDSDEDDEDDDRPTRRKKKKPAKKKPSRRSRDEDDESDDDDDADSDDDEDE